MQTGKCRDIPVILVGSDYWSGLIGWLESRVLEMGMIAKKDLRLFSLVDTSEEAVRLVKEGWERLQQETPGGA